MNDSLKQQLIIAVVASIVTAVILATVATSMDLFRKEIAEDQVASVATELLRGGNRDLLITIMEGRDTFRGADGSSGPRGPAGPKGEVGELKLKSQFFSNTEPQGKGSISQLGNHRLCFLSGAANENRPNDTAICEVRLDDAGASWELYAYGSTCWAGCVN